MQLRYSVSPSLSVSLGVDVAAAWAAGRYARELYSRVGFVHEYRPLPPSEVRSLLHRRWCLAGMLLPDDAIADEESISSIIRVTGGNFRLLHRLLTQIGRVLEINRLNRVTLPVIEAARESLVIGTA